MTVAAPDTPGIADVPINRQVHRIRINTDDDDSDNTIDSFDNVVAGENDLLYTKVEFNYSWQQLIDNNFRVVLERPWGRQGRRTRGYVAVRCNRP